MGVVEIALLGLCCVLPLVLGGGAGLALLLVKLGVIGSYWLRGEKDVQPGGEYTLEQSADAARRSDEES
ncbi:MAG: hypothetical protein D6796_01245 [Caldilineae bacterium]|nr:MAG: hypothetical protein D6796_01245 [Caldilineae bacterium]